MGQDGIGATLTGTLENGEIVTLEIPLPLTLLSHQSPRHRPLLPRPALRFRIPDSKLCASARLTAPTATTWPPKPKNNKTLKILKI